MAPRKKNNPVPTCPEDEIEKNLTKLTDALEEALETGRKVIAKGEALEKKEKTLYSDAEELLKSFGRSCSEKLSERDDLIRQMDERFTEYEEDSKATIADLNKKYLSLLSENDTLQQEKSRHDTHKFTEDDIQQYKDKIKSLRAERDSLERKIEEEKKETARQKRKATTEHNKEKKAADKEFEKAKKDMQREFEKEKQSLREEFKREKQEIEERQSARDHEGMLKLKQRVKELENEAQKAKTHKRLMQSRLESQKKSIMNVMRDTSPILPIPSPLGNRREREKDEERRRSKRAIDDPPPPRKSPKKDITDRESRKENISDDDQSSLFVVRRRRRRFDVSTPPQRRETPPRKPADDKGITRIISPPSDQKVRPVLSPPSDLKVSCVRRFGKSKSRARSIAAPHDITNTHTPGSHGKKDRRHRYDDKKSMPPPPKTSSAFMDLTFSPLSFASP